MRCIAHKSLMDTSDRSDSLMCCGAAWWGNYSEILQKYVWLNANLKSLPGWILKRMLRHWLPRLHKQSKTETATDFDLELVIWKEVLFGIYIEISVSQNHPSCLDTCDRILRGPSILQTLGAKACSCLPLCQECWCWPTPMILVPSSKGYLLRIGN